MIHKWMTRLNVKPTHFSPSFSHFLPRHSLSGQRPVQRWLRLNSEPPEPHPKWIHKSSSAHTENTQKMPFLIVWPRISQQHMATDSNKTGSEMERKIYRCSRYDSLWSFQFWPSSFELNATVSFPDHHNPYTRNSAASKEMGWTAWKYFWSQMLQRATSESTHCWQCWQHLFSVYRGGSHCVVPISVFQ